MAGEDRGEQRPAGKERIEDALKRELERLRERGDLPADKKALPEPSNSKLRRELENQAA